MKEDKYKEIEELKDKVKKLESKIAEVTASRDFHYNEYVKTKQQFDSFKNIVRSLVIIAN